MSKESKEIYEFGPFRLDVGEHILKRVDGEVKCALPEKAFQTLVVLARNHGRLLTKSELLDAVWADSFVEENNLDKAVHAIRHVLGESAKSDTYIETVRKHGYRFVIEVRRVDSQFDLNEAVTGLRTSGGNRVGILGAPTESAAVGAKLSKTAFEQYQQARVKYYQMTAPTTLEAREMIAELLRTNPDFALAHSLSAELTTLEVIVGLKWPETGFAEARESIARAYELGADSADFYSAAAYVDLIADWDFAAAEEKLSKALAINPLYSTANRMMAEVNMFQCRHDSASAYGTRAQVDELALMVNTNILAISRFFARDFQATIDACDKVLALYPGFIIAEWTKCWALEQVGRVNEAIAGYKKTLSRPYGEPALRWVGYAYALAGDRHRALDTASQLQAAGQVHNVSPTHLATIYAALGETDKAISQIERSFEMRDPWMLWIAADPRFDNLRENRRFDEIVKRVLEKATPASEEKVTEIIGNTNEPRPKPQITASGQHALVDLADWQTLIDRLDADEKAPAAIGHTVSPVTETMERGIRQRADSYIRWIPLAGLIIVLGIAAFLGAKLWLPTPKSAAGPVSQKRLTTEGGATRAAISPDGRYAAVAQNAALILFDLQSGDERVLVPASKDIRIMTITFSPNGADVYFGTRRVDQTLVSIYRMPLTGGEPIKVLDDIYGSLAFSPDGQKIAFVRRYPELNEYALLTADSDGSDPNKLATSRLPDRFDGSPAWSADGGKIVCSAIRLDGGFHFTIATIDALSGTVDYVPGQRWKSVGSMSWLADSRSIVVAAQHDDSINLQVWRVDSETGAASRITDDSFVYESISSSTDGRFIVAVKVRQTSHVWILGDQIVQLTAGFDNYDGFNGLAWSVDGNIFYHSRANGRDTIWRVKTDGSEAAEITRDAGGGFAISPDGRTLVFQDKQSADHLGLQIMNLADGSVRSLTRDMTASQPSFFPDGKRLVFSRYDTKLSLYEISVDGGQPKLLSDEFRTASTPSVSPSGRLVAFAINRVQNGNVQSGIGVADSVTKKMISSHIVKIALGSQYEKSTIQWSADESEVYYLQLDNSVSNIMKLKLADGTVTNVTNFTDGRIFNFAVEPGGNRMLISRGIVERDASLLQIDQPL
ncbi:MAG: hypothetical protein HOP17_13085 [Acidobacteria bacterium]|nr:hypothetical protein [Acidobacteriota bacterium]